MSVARNLFDKLRSLGGLHVESLVGTPIEDLYLDCKLTTSIGGKLSKPDKQSFAKAASAFANAEGGVILWGVHHKRDDLGIDQVVSTPGVRDCLAFSSALADAVGQLLGPPVEGYESEILDGSFGSKYLLSLVPRGASLHMARGEDQHCFFLRTGSGTHKMETFEIAARFGKLPEPKLVLSARVERSTHKSGPEGTRQYFNVIITVDNIGAGIGRTPALSIQVDSEDEELSITPPAGLTERPNASHARDRRFKVLVGPDVILYPELSQDLAIVNTMVVGSSEPQPLTVECALFHQGHPVRATFVVSASNFAAADAGATEYLQSTARLDGSNTPYVSSGRM